MVRMSDSDYIKFLESELEAALEDKRRLETQLVRMEAGDDPGYGDSPPEKDPGLLMNILGGGES